MAEDTIGGSLRSFLFAGFILITGVLLCLGLAHNWSGTSLSRNEIRDCSGTYEVLALSFASGKYAKGRMVYGSGAERVPLEFVFFVVLGESRTILVDTGSEDKSLLGAFEARNLRPPILLLEQIGIHREEITDILLTHAHWDHIGCISQFPNARIWIQTREFDHVCSLLSDGREAFINGYRAVDASALVEIKKQGRVVLIKGDREILPCLWALAVENGHTPGSQFVAIKTKAGIVVLGGDNAYLYENIDKEIPIGATLNRKNSKRAIRRMLNVASFPDLVIPGHDPEVFERYPCPRPFVACLAGCEDLHLRLSSK